MHLTQKRDTHTHIDFKHQIRCALSLLSEHGGRGAPPSMHMPCACCHGVLFRVLRWHRRGVPSPHSPAPLHPVSRQRVEASGGAAVAGVSSLTRHEFVASVSVEAAPEAAETAPAWAAAPAEVAKRSAESMAAAALGMTVNSSRRFGICAAS